MGVTLFPSLSVTRFKSTKSFDCALPLREAILINLSIVELWSGDIARIPHQGATEASSTVLIPDHP